MYNSLFGGIGYKSDKTFNKIPCDIAFGCFLSEFRKETLALVKWINGEIDNISDIDNINEIKRINLIDRVRKIRERFGARPIASNWFSFFFFESDL